MLTVFRTVCSTDWKCRPSHSLVIVGQAENQEKAVEMMNQDIHVWMVVDVAVESGNEVEVLVDDISTTTRTDVLLLKTQDEVKEMWENEERWEMKLDSGKVCREFVEKIDEDRTTTVYHFI